MKRSPFPDAIPGVDTKEQHRAKVLAARKKARDALKLLSNRKMEDKPRGHFTSRNQQRRDRLGIDDIFPDYDDVRAVQVWQAARMGLTNEAIASLVFVDPTLFSHMVNPDRAEYHKEFALALYEGRHNSLAKVVNATYQNATGYSHDAVKIHFTKDGDVIRENYTERYRPDQKAAEFLLINRAPEQWKRTSELTLQGPGGSPLIPPVVVVVGIDPDVDKE